MLKLLGGMLENLGYAAPSAHTSGRAALAAFANGELVNYYQPKVAMSSGAVVGVETLVHADSTLRAIFESILNLARQLGIEVVADVVEDQADWDFLRQTGCDLAQGYFIARPMPAADLPVWIETWEARRLELYSA